MLGEFEVYVGAVHDVHDTERELRDRKQHQLSDL